MVALKPAVLGRAELTKCPHRRAYSSNVNSALSYPVSSGQSGPAATPGVSGNMALPNDLNGLPTADNSTPPPGQPQIHRTSAGPSDPSNSPISRTITPGAQQSSNIAPQHLFDGVTLNEHALHASPSLPSFNIRQPSPGSTSSQHDRRSEAKPPYDQLYLENTALKTRVSELEVINILYKGQVGEQDQKATESGQQLRQLLEEAQRRENDLRQQVKELEQENIDLRGGEPAPKRQRASDMSEYPDPSEHATTDSVNA
ncbi:MAG: hypothetical protein Q9170_007437 [Blastenia crenularia]